MKSLCTLEELPGEPAFRIKQVEDWVYRKRARSVDEMTNLSKALRASLKKDFAFPTIEKIRTQESGDEETYKYLWRLPDGKLVESVLICSGERRTMCVSSQVGCPARCAFCASGKEGLFRNLETAEIVEQALMAEAISHIVFMGMGEPLLNYDSVIPAIRILNEKLGISKRRITLSTVGIIEGIERLTCEGLPINLVLSLHAPNQHIRKKIIPYARKYPLPDLLDAMRAYSAKTHRDITYEYILIAGLNDQEEHARELASLLKNDQCTVNLIPYNPVPGLRLKKPESRAVEVFRKILDDHRINNTCRYTKGDDIAAACGQLALQNIP